MTPDALPQEQPMSDRWQEHRESFANRQTEVMARSRDFVLLLAERDELLAALKRMLALNHGDITRKGLAEMRAAYAAAERLIAGDKTE